MSLLTIRTISTLLHVLHNPRELLSTLDLLVVSVLTMCVGFGRLLMIDDPKMGFAMAWVSSLGTILFWILAVFILREFGLV